MGKKIMIKTCVIILLIIDACSAGCCAKSSEPAKADLNITDAILEQLNKKTKQIKSYEALIQYRFSQPLLESQSIRNGVLYYAKYGNRSFLRANFQTLQQDDEKQQKHIEHFIFDGIWLTHIDYQIKTVKRYQLAEPNEPMDAFDLAGRSLPIIGFTKVEDLKKQFNIQLVPQNKTEPSAFIQLHLKVKPDSAYKNEYSSIDFWIDKKLYLPAKVATVSTEEDIYEIEFLKPKVNKKIHPKVFEFKIPGGFSVETEPLKKEEKN